MLSVEGEEILNAGKVERIYKKKHFGVKIRVNFRVIRVKIV